MASYTGRRKFLATLLGGAAAAWPVAARAQQGARVRRIGVFMPGVADDPEGQARIGAFLQGLGELGWIVGRNVRIDYRWGAGDVDRYRAIATELVALAPDAIVALGYAAVSALQKATRSVPIVFTNVIDPVGGSLVASLARPGGNTTGFSNPEFGFAAKWLELLKEIAPGVMRVAVLRDFGDRLPGRAVRQHPVGGAIARGRAAPDRYPRCRRHRARCRRIRQPAERRLDLLRH